MSSSSSSSSLNDKILNTLLLIFNNNTLQLTSPQIIESFQSLINDNIQNAKSLTFIFQQIQNQILNLKGIQKKDIITLIPYIIKTNPKQLLPYTDKIISLYQSCISEDSSKLFTYISKSFGETSKIIINANHTSNFLLNSSLDTNENMFSNELINIYNQLKSFCMNNIKHNNRYNQICGTLCLTSFIENCAYNYTNQNNLKSIWELLIYQITNNNFYAKLELLNCFISLIFSSEERFCPFASMTLYKIFDYITDEDWLKRKLALNIVYTLVFYCGEEIKPLKGYINKFLAERSEDNVKEVKEVCIEIMKLLENAKVSHSERLLLSEQKGKKTLTHNRKSSEGTRSLMTLSNNNTNHSYIMNNSTISHNSSSTAKTSRKYYSVISKSAQKEKKSTSKLLKSNNNNNVYDSILKVQDDQGRVIVQLQTNIKEIEKKYKEDVMLKEMRLKKELDAYVKNCNYEEAFRCVVELRSVKKMDYVVKNYIMNGNERDDEEIISKDVMKGLLEVFVEDMMKCHSLEMLACFFKENVVDRKFAYEKEFCVKVVDKVNKVLAKKEKLFLEKKEVEYLMSIAKYFDNNNNK